MKPMHIFSKYLIDWYNYLLTYLSSNACILNITENQAWNKFLSDSALSYLVFSQHFHARNRIRNNQRNGVAFEQLYAVIKPDNTIYHESFTEEKFHRFLDIHETFLHELFEHCAF